MEPPPKTVAIIGIGCRFPGSNGPEEFWETLKNGENHITEIPREDRWNVDAFYDENPDATGKSYVKKAGLLDRIHDWDNLLFDVNEYEAIRMDPQQKLALEVTYNALENAGLTSDMIQDTHTAVYMGIMNDDYSKIYALDYSETGNYTATGTANSLVANRTSYTFDLRGPSVTMDTACSSALVAVNYGIGSILSGESEMAVCGGVNLMLIPGPFIALCKARMASKTGQCHSFSQRADGYVRSEGCGVVILKDAHQAMKDNNRIWGFISTACNSDGRAENPISSPSKEMQKRLVETTMQRQCIDMHQVQYVEMHGTGTPVGDPIEVSGIGETIGEARKTQHLPPVNIGSVKSNIGHTESAAGTAGLIKVLMMMENEQYVPSLFNDDLNPSIDFDHLHVNVVNKVQIWPELDNGERVASVNSFGFGGTNVHAIIRRFKKSDKVQQHSMLFNLVCFSGKTEKSVINSMQDTLDAINLGHISSISDLQFTSINHRNHYKFRKAVVFEASKSAAQTILEKSITASKISKKKQDDHRINTVFVFCGMGTHWEKMGLELFNTFPVFQQMIEEMDKLFSNLASFKLEQCLKGEFDLSNPVYGQPAIFAVEVGLVAMLRHFGINPDVIVGHSVGEIAAAYASNVLTLRSAVEVIYHRSRLMEKVQGGSMLAVGGIEVDKVQSYIDENKLDDKICVAAYNTHNSCTISGESGAIDKLHELLEKTHAGIFARKLNVTAAYHSQYMDPIIGELQEELEKCQLTGSSHMTKTKHISSVMCSTDDTQFSKSDYWGQNVRQPVKFDQAFQQTLENNCKNIIIEIGPKAPLKRYIQSIAEVGNKKVKYTSLMTNKSGYKHFLSALAELYEAGVNLHDQSTSSIISWPRYGHDKKTMKQYPQKAIEMIEDMTEETFEHAFVSKNTGSRSELCSVSTITQHRTAFVYDHVIEQDTIVPGATYVEIAAATACLHVAQNLFRKGQSLAISSFFKRACIVSKNDKISTLKTTLFPGKNGSTNSWEYDITTSNILHASGQISVLSKTSKTTLDIALIRSRCTQPFKKEDVYEKLKRFKFNHGPKLQCVQKGDSNKSELLAEILLSDQQYEKYILHPVLLDCVLQLCIMLPASDVLNSSAQMIPFGIEEVLIESSPPERSLVHINIVEATDSMFKVDGEILGIDGKIYVQCKGLTIGVMGKASMTNMSDIMFCQSWEHRDFVTDESALPLKSVLVTNYIAKEIKDLKRKGLANYCIDINEIMCNESALKDKFPKDIDTYTDIIYAFSSTNNNITESASGEKVSDIQADLCFTLITIIRYAQQYPGIQITVLTNQVYEVLQGDPNNLLDGLLGYALWGMMRTVKAENPFQKFKCIDVSDHTKMTFETITHLLSSAKNTNEINISHGKPKSCQLIAMPQSSEHRVVKASSDDIVTVCAENSSTVYENLSSYFQSGKVEQKNRTVDLHNALVISPSKLFHESPTNGVYSAKRQIKCFGATGIEKKKNRLVHLVQMLPVCNKVSVDQAVIPFSEFPSTLPSAPYWLFAWMLMKGAKLNGKSKVSVASYNDNNTWAIAIEQVCRLTKCDISKDASGANFFIVANNKEDIRSLLEEVLDKNNESLSVLTWSVDSADEIETYFSTSNRDVNVLCLQELYTKPDMLKSNINKFRSWLKSLRKQKLQDGIDKVNTELQAKQLDMTNLTREDKIASDTVLVIQSAHNSDLPVTVTKEALYRKDAGYLVFGGSKGQGWEVVLDLVANGAGKIGIVSRNGLSSDKKLLVEDLQKRNNCTIVDLKADVSNYQELVTVKTVFAEKDPKKILRGIFIGSVVLSDATIPKMTLDMFKYVQRPKVIGIWNVHNVFQDQSLDFFIAHSSLTSMFGNPGQTNYAAANAFVDAFMCYRRKMFGVGQSLCWGGLDLGLLNDQSKKNKVLSLGIGLMNKTEILECLHHSLMYNPMLISYAKFAWEVFIKRTAPSKNVTNYFGELFKRKGHYLKTSDFLDSDQQKKKGSNSHAFLPKVLKTILMMDEDDELEMNESLMNLGADSHHGTLIYSTILDNFGDISGLSPLKILDMTVNELQVLVSPQSASESESTDL